MLDKLLDEEVLIFLLYEWRIWVLGTRNSLDRGDFIYSALSHNGNKEDLLQKITETDLLCQKKAELFKEIVPLNMDTHRSAVFEGYCMLSSEEGESPQARALFLHALGKYVGGKSSDIANLLTLVLDATDKYESREDVGVSGGGLHIFLQDFNCHDDALDFCYKHCLDKKDFEGATLALLWKQIPYHLRGYLLRHTSMFYHGDGNDNKNVFDYQVQEEPFNITNMPFTQEENIITEQSIEDIRKWLT